MPQEIKQASGIIYMGLDDSGPGGIIGFGIVPAAADKIGRERAFVIRVYFSVRQFTQFKVLVQVLLFAELFAPGDDPSQQFVVGRIIPFGAGNGQQLVGIAGKAETEIVGLDLLVATTSGGQLSVVNAVYQSAGGFARHDVGVNAVFKLVSISWLYPVKGFPVLSVILPPDGIGYPGLGHQIAFVGAVNKYLSADSVLQGAVCSRYGGRNGNGADLCAGFHGGGQPVACHHFYACLVNIIVEQLFGHMRFYQPLYGKAVALPVPLVKVPCQTRNGSRITYICIP